MFEVLDHTADVGLRVTAATREDLFAEAARGMFSLICANLEAVRPLEKRTVEVPFDEERQEVADDPHTTAPTAACEDLLHDWLGALLLLFETQRFLGCRFEVAFHNDHLWGVVHGEPIDPARHEFAMEIKAVTYHHLCVEQTPGGWRGEVIFDL